MKLKIFCFFVFLSSFFALSFADRFSYLELFAQTLNTIKINYFKPIKLETLIYGAIKGLLREIDPHSHFLLPQELEYLTEEAKGQFYGLGIEVESQDDFLIVISVMDNSPAQKAGLKQGDKILKIDDKNVKNWTVDEFRTLFRTHQKKYKILIFRLSLAKPLVFFVRPEKLKSSTVYFQKLEKSLFYLRVYYFSSKTLLEVNRFLKNKTIKGLLLDLRSNPGGLLDPSVKLADLFLNKGLIVSYKIKTEDKAKNIVAHYSDTLEYFPLVVLIDEYSASGSEIVAGALKDHKRATLIGRKTFGKGSIQSVFYLSKNHALKLTVGEYQTPLGYFIHEKGISPHILLPQQKTKKWFCLVVKLPCKRF